MLDQAKVVSISDIQHQSVGQWLPIDSTSTDISINFDHELKAFTFSKNTLGTSDASHQLELVIFDSLSVLTLTKLLSTCQIQLESLTAINNRNNVISYRFIVNVNNFTFAKEQLVRFNQANDIESALLLNAPYLKQPGLLVMDMDSTAIKIECIDEIAALAGVGEEVAAITELAMQGKLDFRESLYQRVGKLANAPESILENVAKNLPLMEGLETLTKQLKQHQWRIAIASGGFTYFADHLKSLLKLDLALANTLEIKNNRITGEILGDVIDAQAKADCLNALRNKFEIPSSQTVAMGDGANDLVMMSAAQLGVAHHAKPVVLAKADSCLTTSGLDGLLHWLR